MTKQEAYNALDRVHALNAERRYREALNIVEAIDEKFIKAVPDMNTVIETYLCNKRFESAKEWLVRLREKSSSTRVLSQLVLVCLKLDQVDEARFYYDKFVEIAPNDAARYELEYRIRRKEGAEYGELIEILKKLNQEDYDERWGYELAKLYHKAGMEKECIAECDNMILWFGEGELVEKAKLLRAYHLGEDVMTRMKESSEEDRPEESTADSHAVEADAAEGAQDAAEPAPEETSGTAEDTAPETEEEPETAVETGDQAENGSAEEGEAAEAENTAEPAAQAPETDDTAEAAKPAAVQAEAARTAETPAAEAPAAEVPAAEKAAAAQQEPEDAAVTQAVKAAQEAVAQAEQEAQEDRREYVSEPVRIQPTKKQEPIPEMTFAGVDLRMYFGEEMRDDVFRSEIEYLCTLLTNGAKPHFLITGANYERCLTFTRELVRFLKGVAVIDSAKTAKISGEKLNLLNLPAQEAVLRGCTLIIEGGNCLTDSTRDGIRQFRKDLNGQTTVMILETGEVSKEWLLNFGCRIDLPENN